MHPISSLALHRSLLTLALATFATGLVVQSATAQLEPVDDEDAQATPYYRVDVIAFQHTDGQSDGFRSLALNDYSAVLDPLRLVEVRASADAALARFEPVLSLFHLGTSQADVVDEDPNPMPPVYRAQGSLSNPMQSILERLQRSERYVPLGWRSWYQTAERGENTYWTRLHDERVIEWPEPIEIVAQPDLPSAEPNYRSRDDANFDGLDPTHSFDVAAIEMTPLQPIQHFRLDGQLRLHQRQFLHLYFDMEWREPSGRPAPIRDIDTDSLIDRSEHDPSPEWRVHRFAQSRIVRPDRLEYFDSELIGVVALLTLIEPAEAPTDGDESD
ncbi:MAG: CsiV family protein [Pseudomonadota bacterium]